MTAKRLTIAVVSILMSVVVLEAVAQFELPKRLPRIPLPGLDRIPGMDKLLGKEVPVTTSLTDVLTEVPFLDFYSPKFPMSAGHAARNSDAQFNLTPGAWTYQAQSYCLKAGTHGPGRGEGYGYAPLKGPKAPIVQSILRRSVDHPEIGQHEVQYLLWAIIARAKLSEMSRENQATAAKLLTPKEMFDLNGGALGILPESAKARLMADLPPALKSIVEAENRIRQMVTQANASFDEVERVAVLLGEPAPDAADRTDLPRQRWSYHPDGYFIRFDPHGYSSTNVDIYVPKPYTIVRDRKDRIVLIADDEGRRIDILYAPSTVKGTALMRAYRFERVRFADASMVGKASVVGEWEKTGWTLVGIPDDSNTVAGETLAMTDIAARLVNSRRRGREFENLVKQVGKRGQKSSPQALVRDLVDLAHLQDALSALPAKKTDKRIAQQLDQVAEAWQYTLQRGVTEPAEQRASLFPPEGPGQSASGASGGNVDVDPSENVGVPGQTGRQRLGQSARCGKECGCDRKKFCSDLDAAVSTLAREMSNATSTRASIAQAGQQKLKELAKGLCDNPELAAQVQEMINQLNSAASGSSVQGYQTIARVQIDLENMQKQVCGGPPPKKDCPDGTQPATPGDEQAAKQVTDALDQAKKDLLNELQKFDEGVPDYIQRGKAFRDELTGRLDKINTLLNLWSTFKNTKCIPPNIIPLMRQILENQRNHTPSDAECTMLCAETAKWYGKLINSPGSYQEKMMMETCLAWCH